MISLPLGVDPPDFAALAATKVAGSEPAVMRGRAVDLADHLAGLEKEFAGSSALAFYHAALNVLIRRGIQTDLALQHFQSVWTEQGTHLLQLSARWLVAACDTLATHAPDKSERAIACLGATLLNVIKLYETELLTTPPRSPNALRALIHPQPLFDGMTSFSVGHGDMIFNLRERTRALCSELTIASRIVLELLDRVDRHDTIFRRLAAVHVNPETNWRASEQSESLRPGAPES